MATLSLQDILNADSFSFGTESLSQISADNIAKNKDINLEGLSVTSASILDDLFASSAKSDGSCRPKQISYQPLAEAAAFTSGTNQSTSALGAIVNNSNAFLDTSKDYIDKSAALNPDLGEAANFSKERVIDANRILSTGAMALSNSSEKANGGIVFSSATDFKLAGNNVYLGSESIMHTASPIIVSNAKVGQYQENFRSLTFDAEHKIGQSSFKQVDFSHRIHSFDHKLTAQSDRSFSKDMERTATNVNRTAGDQTQLYANSHMEAASANTYRGTARGSMVHQAGDISIAASSGTLPTSSSNKGGAQGQTSLGTPSFVPPNGCITIAASGDKLKSSGGNKGNITLVSTSSMTQASKDMVEMSEQLANFVKKSARILAKDVMHQAWGTFTGLAKGKNQVFVGNDTSSMVMKKRRIHINQKIRVDWKMPNPLNINIPEILDIPALPELPSGLAEQDLASCIPERYRQSNAPGRTPPTFPNGTAPSPTSKPSYEPSHQRNKPNFDPYCKSDCIIPTNNSTGTTANTGNNSNNSNAGNSNALKNPVVVDKNKLPPNTNTSSDAPNTTQDRVTSALNIVVGKPVASVKGGLDIYINRPEDTAVVFNPIDPSTASDDPLEEYSDVFIDNKVVDDLIKSLQESADELSKDILTINAKRLSTPNTTLTELESNFSTVKLLNSLPSDILYNLTSSSNIDLVEATTAEKAKLTSLLVLPGAADLISASFKELNATVGIGFLGSILSFAGDLASGISDAVSVISNVNDILSGGLNLGTIGAIAGVSLGNLGSVAGALVAGKNLGLSSFINTFAPGLTGTGDIGKSLLNGNTGTKFAADFNTSVKNSINTTVTKVVSKIPGGNGAQTVAGISTILGGIKTGTLIDKTKLLGQLQTVLTTAGVTIPGAAAEVYDGLSDAINGLSSGNVADVLSGSSLRKLLSYIVGPSNIAVLDQVSSAIGSGQDLFKSLSKIPALLGMMNNYDIPLLDQISSILSCVDIIQQVEDLFHSVEDIFDDQGGTTTNPQLEDILQLFENLPRLIQTLNGVQATTQQILIDLM